MSYEITMTTKTWETPNVERKTKELFCIVTMGKYIYHMGERHSPSTRKAKHNRAIGRKKMLPYGHIIPMSGTYSIHHSHPTALLPRSYLTPVIFSSSSTDTAGSFNSSLNDEVNVTCSRGRPCAALASQILTV